MATPFVGQFGKQIKQWRKRLFADPELMKTGTYSNYRGHNEEPLVFSVPVINVSTILEAQFLDSNIPIQENERIWWIQEDDLPEGVTAGSLTLNDRLTIQDIEMMVTKIDPTLEFVIEITTAASR